jgi:hypothetical protein
MSLDWLGPSVTLALGVAAFFVGGLNERQRDQRLSVREHQAREQAARERRADERNRFQLENYLALQDALRECMRAHTMIIWADIARVKEHGNFGHLPEDLDQEAFSADILFNRLANRVLDDEMRDQLGEFKSAAVTTKAPPLDKSISNEDAIALLHGRNSTLSDVYQKTADMVGVRLRLELGREAN